MFSIHEKMFVSSTFFFILVRKTTMLIAFQDLMVSDLERYVTPQPLKNPVRSIALSKEMLYQPGNAPDYISECLTFQNIPGEDSPDSPTRALNLTSAAFEREHPHTYYEGKTCLFACLSPCNQIR